MDKYQWLDYCGSQTKKNSHLPQEVSIFWLPQLYSFCVCDKVQANVYNLNECSLEASLFC